MPGKVNPVMPEMMIQVCAQVIGNDASMTLGGLMGQLDLNAMMPLMAHNLLQSIKLLANACHAFNSKCVSQGPEMPGDPENSCGISANRDRCRQLVESSLMPVTALVPIIGYRKAAQVASESVRTGKTIREIVLAEDLIPLEELESLLDLTNMTRSSDSPGSRESSGIHVMAGSENAIDRWRDDGGHQLI